MSLYQIPMTLLLALLGPGVFWAFWQMLGTVWQNNTLALCLLFGTFIGAIIDHYVARKLPFFRVYEHEFTHGLVALLFLREIKDFKVTFSRGGHVSFTDGFGGQFGNMVIILAPYVLPTVTCILVIVRACLSQPLPWFDVLIGMSLGFHTCSTIAETRTNWSRTWWHLPKTLRKTDIEQVLPWFALIYIPVVTVAIHGLLLGVLGQGMTGLTRWVSAIWYPTLQVSQAIGLTAGLNSIFARITNL